TMRFAAHEVIANTDAVAEYVGRVAQARIHSLPYAKRGGGLGRGSRSRGAVAPSRPPASSMGEGKKSSLPYAKRGGGLGRGQQEQAAAAPSRPPPSAMGEG